MAKIERFEDVKSWQSARTLALAVYELSSVGDFGHDFALRDQIRRAAGSIMHNIAEGFESGSDKEFIRFLIYARRSASEVQSQLYLASGLGYLSSEQFYALYEQATDVKKLVNAFIGYLRK